MATVRDVAKAAGVSAATVSRVINGNVAVNEKTRARVLNAMSELNFTAAAPKPGLKTRNVGIIIPAHSASNLSGHPAFYSAITMFVEELKKNGAENTLLLLDDRHLNNIEELFANRLDGYFILGTSEEQEDVLLPYLKNESIPYMILNRWVNEKYTNYVNVNDVVAAYNAAKWLIGLGHTKIAFINGNKNFRNSKLRTQGFTLALQESGLEIPDSYVLQGEYSEEYGYLVGETVYKMKDRPTAALFSSDMIAVGFQRRMREYGVRLPEEFAMVGWGNFNISAYVRPALTTVNVPNADMGGQAALALINMIKNPGVLRTQILMDAPLIIRESCGGIPATPPGVKKPQN